MNDCTWRDRREDACSIAIVCERCHRCLLHCACPPPELRGKNIKQLGKSLVHKFQTRRVIGRSR